MRALNDMGSRSEMEVDDDSEALKGEPNLASVTAALRQCEDITNGGQLGTSAGCHSKSSSFDQHAE